MTDEDLLADAMTPGALEGFVEPRDDQAQALADMRTRVAHTLHETVLQTLVATTYLAESSITSRRDLIEYLRQATHELRTVIDCLSSPDEGEARP